MIFELGGRSPLTRLRELAAALPGRDRELLARGAQLGLVIDEYRAEPRQGDFLIRGLAGADLQSGAVMVGDAVQVGQTVQFHVRDAGSADEDLRRTLQQEVAALGGRGAAGALFHLQRPRLGAVPRARPRRRAGRDDAGQHPGGGVLLPRRTRAGERTELPARLYRVHRAIPARQPVNSGREQGLCQHQTTTNDARSSSVTATDWSSSAPGTGHYAEVNGINLYFETRGAGQPLIYNVFGSPLFAAATLAFLDQPFG